MKGAVMDDETRVGIAPNEATLAALAWSVDDDDTELPGEEPPRGRPFTWVALVVLMFATMAAVLWLAATLLRTLVQPTTPTAAPRPPAVISAPTVTVTAPMPSATIEGAPASTIEAAPTHEPTADDRFLAKLNAQGMTDPNPSEVLANVHAICKALAQGHPVGDVHRAMMDSSPGLTDRTVSAFIEDAMTTYPNCGG